MHAALVVTEMGREYYFLLLCRRIRRGRRRSCGLRLGGRRFLALQHGLGSALLDGVDGEGYRRQHEKNGRNGSCSGERCGCAAWAKRGLTTLSAEGRRDVPSLPALQQNDNNQKQANDHVDDGDKENHEIEGPKLFRMSANGAEGGI
jgi:hypothetical protein